MANTFNINPNKQYRIRPNSSPIRPVNDPDIGISFSPQRVILDNLRDYRLEKALIERGIISSGASIIQYRGLSEDDLVEQLRTMVYDVSSGRTLEETLGGRKEFDRIVKMAGLKLEKGWQPASDYDSREDVFTSDSVFEPKDLS